jgi:hypothetical protein
MELPDFINKTAFLYTLYVIVGINVLRLILILFTGWDMPLFVVLIAPWTYLLFLYLGVEKEDPLWVPADRVKGKF